MDNTEVGMCVGGCVGRWRGPCTRNNSVLVRTHHTPQADAAEAAAEEAEMEKDGSGSGSGGSPKAAATTALPACLRWQVRVPPVRMCVWLVVVVSLPSPYVYPHPTQPDTTQTTNPTRNIRWRKAWGSGTRTGWRGTRTTSYSRSTPWPSARCIHAAGMNGWGCACEVNAWVCFLLRVDVGTCMWTRLDPSQHTHTTTPSTSPHPSTPKPNNNTAWPPRRAAPAAEPGRHSLRQGVLLRRQAEPAGGGGGRGGGEAARAVPPP